MSAGYEKGMGTKMTIETKITERDRKLLAFLAVFVIAAVFGNWIIRPLAAACIEEEMLCLEQSEIMTDHERKSRLLPALREETEKLKREAERSADRFYPLMPAYEVGRLLTNLAVGRGLEVRQLNIEMPETEWETAAGTQEGEAAEKTLLTGIYAARASMRIAGGREDMRELLDVLASEHPPIRVKEAIWGKQRRETPDASGKYSSVEEDILLLELEIYMCGAA